MATSWCRWPSCRRSACRRWGGRRGPRRFVSCSVRRRWYRRRRVPAAVRVLQLRCLRVSGDAGPALRPAAGPTAAADLRPRVLGTATAPRPRVGAASVSALSLGAGTPSASCPRPSPLACCRRRGATSRRCDAAQRLRCLGAGGGAADMTRLDAGLTAALGSVSAPVSPPLPGRVRHRRRRRRRRCRRRDAPGITAAHRPRVGAAAVCRLVAAPLAVAAPRPFIGTAAVSVLRLRAAPGAAATPRITAAAAAAYGVGKCQCRCRRSGVAPLGSAGTPLRCALSPTAVPRSAASQTSAMSHPALQRTPAGSQQLGTQEPSCAHTRRDPEGVTTSTRTAQKCEEKKVSDRHPMHNKRRLHKRTHEISVEHGHTHSPSHAEAIKLHLTPSGGDAFLVRRRALSQRRLSAISCRRCPPPRPRK